MTHQNKLTSKLISSLIAQACATLRLSDKQIKEMFTPIPICISDYHENNEKERFIEVRFDEEQTSVICLFDIDDRCDTAFICPDSPNTFTDYVNYLNSIYKYDYISGKWLLPNGYLAIKRSKDLICLMIH